MCLISISFKCRWMKMEHHDVILECAKFASLDTLERPREDVSYQGLPPTSRKRYSLEYSSLGNFGLGILQCRELTQFVIIDLPMCCCQDSQSCLNVFNINFCEKWVWKMMWQISGDQIQHFKLKFLAFFICHGTLQCAACIFFCTPEFGGGYYSVCNFDTW